MIKNPKILNLNVVLIFIISLIFLSCSDDKFEVKDNGKTNYYPTIDRFQNQYFAATDWKIEPNNGYLFQALVLDEKSVLVVTNSNELIKITDIVKEWSVKLDENKILAQKPTSNNNQIIISFLDGSYICYDSLGKKRWEYSLNSIKKTSLPLECLILDNNDVILGNTEGNIICLDKNGKTKWSYISNGILYKTIVSDKNSNIYVNSQKSIKQNNDSLLIIDKNGKLIKSMSFEGEEIIRNPVITNNRIYLTTSIYKNAFEFAKLYSYDFNYNQKFNKELAMLPRHLSAKSETDEVFLVMYNSGLGNNSNNGIFTFDKNGAEKWHIYYDYSIPHPVIIGQKEICFTASNQETIGLFYVDIEKGNNIYNVSLGSFPDFHLTPAIGKDGNFIYTCLQNQQYISVDGTPLDKMLRFK